MSKIIQKDLDDTNQSADEVTQQVEASSLTGGLMDIHADQSTIAAKGYIQAQEDREDFILQTGVEH